MNDNLMSHVSVNTSNKEEQKTAKLHLGHTDLFGFQVLLAALSSLFPWPGSIIHPS